jgi:transposase
MVSAPVEPLPDDITMLQALVRSLAAERDTALAERDTVVAERDRVSEQNDRLRHLLRQLQRARFGRSSEKLDPDQLQLALEDVEQALAQGEASDDHPKPPKQYKAALAGCVPLTPKMR